MQVTTENVKELISKYLDKKKIKYKIEENSYGNSTGLSFEFYTKDKNSEENGLQEPNRINYEYSNSYENEDEDGNLTPIIIFTFNSQFLEENSSTDEPLLEIENDNINEESELIDQIDEFLFEIEGLNNAIVDIRESLRKIQNICDENGFNFEDLITLNYKFKNLHY